MDPLTAQVLGQPSAVLPTISVNDVVHVKGKEKDQNPSTNWTVEDVVSWLRTEGFEDGLCDKFLEQEVSGDILLKLDAGRIKFEFPEMTLGMRIRLEDAINRLMIGDDQPKPQLPEARSCPFNHITSNNKNLVVCIDGTSNQFGEKNTNVVELYKMLVKDDKQLTYYNSGIGSFPKPQKWSFEHWIQVLDHKIDLAIAWNFAKRILDAYRWLSRNYQAGDCIFLFGFSRGAYQVRTLAAMIHTVGLLHKFNEEQIPFAYELYTSLGTHKYSSDDNRRKGAHCFKSAFCHSNVFIHFIGAWDTVSSVGITRGKGLPDTLDPELHTCYFRHALAADERRVKFLPEYAHGGASRVSEEQHERSLNSDGDLPRIKEVWFRGTHSDIGGGNTENLEMTRNHPAYLWIAYEGQQAGLRISEPVDQAGWNLTGFGQVNESLTGFFWRAMEYLPIKRLTYKTNTQETRRPHRGRGRKIKAGQLIHPSFAYSYVTRAPKAVLYDDKRDLRNLVGVGAQPNISWIKPWRDLLEGDCLNNPPENLLDHIPQSHQGSKNGPTKRTDGDSHDQRAQFEGAQTQGYRRTTEFKVGPLSRFTSLKMPSVMDPRYESALLVWLQRLLLQIQDKEAREILREKQNGVQSCLNLLPNADLTSCWYILVAVLDIITSIVAEKSDARVFAQLTDIVHNSKDPTGRHDILFSFLTGDPVNDVKRYAIKRWADYERLCDTVLFPREQAPALIQNQPGGSNLSAVEDVTPAYRRLHGTDRILTSLMNKLKSDNEGEYDLALNKLSEFTLHVCSYDGLLRPSIIATHVELLKSENPTSQAASVEYFFCLAKNAKLPDNVHGILKNAMTKLQAWVTENADTSLAKSLDTKRIHHALNSARDILQLSD